MFIMLQDLTELRFVLSQINILFFFDIPQPERANLLHHFPPCLFIFSFSAAKPVWWDLCGLSCKTFLARFASFECTHHILSVIKKQTNKETKSTTKKAGALK